MISRRFIFWLGMLMMIVFTLAACTSEPIKQQQQTSTVEDPPESIEDEEEGQTITLVTPDTAMKAPEEKANIRYIHG